MRVGGDDETNVRRGGRGETCVLDEVGVDDGVEEVVVDGVVDMGVLIVVSPANVQWVRKVQSVEGSGEGGPAGGVGEKEGIVATLPALQAEEAGIGFGHGW